MPAIEYETLCDTPTDFPQTTIYPNETSTMQMEEEESGLNAVLYIVVTLLFYSIGIIIGIVTYLKKEKKEMEEEKAFEDYLLMHTDPFSSMKAKRVKQVAARIAFLDEQKRIREEEHIKNAEQELEKEEESDGYDVRKEEKTSRRGSRLWRKDRDDSFHKHVKLKSENTNNEPLSTLVAKILHSDGQIFTAASVVLEMKDLEIDAEMSISNPKDVPEKEAADSNELVESIPLLAHKGYIVTNV